MEAMFEFVSFLSLPLNYINVVSTSPTYITPSINPPCK